MSHEQDEARKNQIAYIENVLGVKTVLRPVGATPTQISVPVTETSAPKSRAKVEARASQALAEPPEASEWFAHGNENSSLIFWHVGPPLTPALRELQDRMIIALKKDPAQILKIEATQLLKNEVAKEKLRELLAKNPDRTIVGLGVESAQMNLDLWRGFATLPELKMLRPGTAFMITATASATKLRFLPTHGLTHLENSPPLKKETWAHLQSLALS